jgi:hypothetical protein
MNPFQTQGQKQKQNGSVKTGKKDVAPSSKPSKMTKTEPTTSVEPIKSSTDLTGCVYQPTSEDIRN